MRRRTGTPDAPGRHLPGGSAARTSALIRPMGRNGVASVAGAICLGCAGLDGSGWGQTCLSPESRANCGSPCRYPAGWLALAPACGVRLRWPAMASQPAGWTRDGTARPSWFVVGGVRPSTTSAEVTGEAIAKLARALARPDRSWATGHYSAGRRVAVWVLGSDGIRPTIPRGLRAESAETERRGMDDAEKRRAFQRWARRVAGEPWTPAVVIAAWRKYRPQDVAKRRTVAKGRTGAANGEAGEP